MGRISDDADEGLGLSLAVYLAAIGATIAALSTVAFYATGTARLENPGMAAYQPPGRTKLIPDSKQKLDFAMDLSNGPRLATTKLARR